MKKIKKYMSLFICMITVSYISEPAIIAYSEMTTIEGTNILSTNISDLCNQIDKLVVYSYNQYNEIMNIKRQYNELSESEKSQIYNYNKLEEAIEKLDKLKYADSTYFIDKSNNNLNPTMGEGSYLVKDNELGITMRGVLEISNTAGVNNGDIFTDLIQGTNPFTVEAWVKIQTYNVNHDVIIGKGDYCFGLRTKLSSGGTKLSLDFFIRGTNNKWDEATGSISYNDEWFSKYHQVVGVYDGKYVRVYLDGELLGYKKCESVDGVRKSDTGLWLGYDPETNRNNNYLFATARVYSKALSDEEIFKQKEGFLGTSSYAVNYDDKDVVMWLEMGEYVVPEFEQADKTLLENLYKNNINRVNEEYTDYSWNRFVNALSNAKDIIDYGRATQNEVDNAYNELVDAISKLGYKVNKKLLQQNVNTAKAIDSNKYTESSYNNLLKAVDRSEDILVDDNVTQETVNSMIEELLKALADLDYRADKSILISLIEIAGDIINHKEDYLDKYIDELLKAVNEGKVVVDDTNITQNIVDYLCIVIQEAIDNLKFKANKTALEAELKNLEDILSNSDKYKPSTLKGLEELVTKGKDIVKEDEASQSIVDNMTIEIIEFISKIEERPDKTELQEAINEGKKYNNSKYTEDTFKKLLSNIEYGEKIVSDVETTEKEVKYITEEILNSINNLVVKSDMTKLEMYMNLSKAIIDDISVYKPSTVLELPTFYNQAKLIFENKNSTQDEVDGITEYLRIAYLRAEKQADRKELEALVNEINDLDKSKYKSSTLVDLLTLLPLGEEALNNGEIEQTEVDDLVVKIKDAFDCMELKSDTSKLIIEIKKAQNIIDNIDKYKPSTVMNLSKLIFEAINISINDESTQDEVDNITELLAEAIEKVELKANKTELIDILDKADAVDKDKFTEDSKDRLNSILNEINDKLKNEDISQSEIDSLIESIKDVINNLESKEEPKDEESNKDESKKDDIEIPIEDNSENDLYSNDSTNEDKDEIVVDEIVVNEARDDEIENVITNSENEDKNQIINNFTTNGTNIEDSTKGTKEDNIISDYTISIESDETIIDDSVNEKEKTDKPKIYKIFLILVACFYGMYKVIAKNKKKE